MLVRDAELRGIIRPFRRIVSAARSNAQQLTNRVCVIAIKIDALHAIHRTRSRHPQGSNGRFYAAASTSGAKLREDRFAESPNAILAATIDGNNLFSGPRLFGSLTDSCIQRLRAISSMLGRSAFLSRTRDKIIVNQDTGECRVLGYFPPADRLRSQSSSHGSMSWSNSSICSSVWDSGAQFSSQPNT